MMQIQTTNQAGDTLLTLTKTGDAIGHCRYHITNGTVTVLDFAIAAPWQRKGYGSYLCKEMLKQTGGFAHGQKSRHCVPCTLGAAFPFAFFEKFGFVHHADAMVRDRTPDLTAVRFAQQFLTQQLTAPTFCIDATCGNGHDSLFLAQWMGETGHLLALDVQPEAIAQTAARLTAAKIAPMRYTLLCENHANLATLPQHAAPDSADAILFNFGWLPGADHQVFSHQESSLPALQAALALLKPGGILSAILYSGEGIGSSEKEAILAWMNTLPLNQYTVLQCNFANWASTAPLPCFIIKK